MPTIIHIQTLPTISRTNSTPALMRSTTVINSTDLGARPHVAPARRASLPDAASRSPSPTRSPRQAEHEIDQCDLPADQRQQKRERDFVDHRRGDQKRKGNAERHAGQYEADKQRNCRARAEGRQHPETRGGDIPDPLAFARKQRARALRREKLPHHAHAEDDEKVSSISTFGVS